MAEEGPPPNGDYLSGTWKAPQDFSTDDVSGNYGEYGATAAAVEQNVPVYQGEPQQQQYQQHGDYKAQNTYAQEFDTSDDTEMAARADADEDTKPTVVHSTNIEPTGRDYTTSEYYQPMLSYGLAPTVIGEVIEMIDGGLIKQDEVEERLFESLKSIRTDQCAFILRRFREANVMGINNIPAYMGSLLKNFKERVRLVGEHAALGQPILSAPAKDKIQAILDRTGYSLEVTIGQRKYGGPPPGWGDAPAPGSGHELYVGKIPREVMEDDLIPLFEECGDLYDLRLMMDAVSGYNKGYAFVTYKDKPAAAAAVEKYEGYEIRKGKRLRVNVSIANTRLFIGNIPKTKGKDEIFEEFSKGAELEGLMGVIIYASPDDPERKKNRGFCFLDFCDHRAASAAKRRLSTGRIRPWNGDIVVDWAEPQEEPDEEIMSQVKVVYVKPLKESVGEEEVREVFKEFGEVDRVKKIKDYAFVHYIERENAVKAIETYNGKELFGEIISCSLARPQLKKSKQDGPYGGGGFGYGGFSRGRGSYMGRGGRGGPPYYGRGGGYPTRGGYGQDSYGGYYGGGEDYGAGYEYGYGGEEYYGEGYGGYFDDGGFGGRAPQGFRGRGRGVPPGGPRGRGGVPARGRGGSGSRGFGGGGRGFVPRGSPVIGIRGRGTGTFPMKRKAGADFDSGAAKRRPGGGRGTWGSRGGNGAGGSVRQGWSAENFAEDSY